MWEKGVVHIQPSCGGTDLCSAKRLFVCFFGDWLTIVIGF